jgi:hypothetical protein
MQITWDIKAKKVFFVFSFSPLSPPFSPKERRIYEKVVLYQRERERERLSFVEPLVANDISTYDVDDDDQ